MRQTKIPEKPMPFDLNIYLQRIGLNDVVSGIDGVRQLQSAQIAAIPFENVYPFLGRVPGVEPDDVWEKLVLQNCGGFCFELNTLFGEALTALGYSIQPVMARVRMGASRGGARTHLAFVVRDEDREWLADTGFGGQAPAEPVSLTSEEPQTIKGQDYRIRIDEAEGEQVLERSTRDGWNPLFGFDRVETKPDDIEAATFLAATWPKEPFANSLKAYRRTEDGWISFQDARARFTRDGISETRQLATSEAFRNFMQDDMGLGYSDEDLKAVWSRLQQIHTGRD
ncbi:N-hydroxyarylamine O-acetyltransferase [Roseibium album]|nr:N-hydroxyarylamine O-acetyltransferase [Roseibium album]